MSMTPPADPADEAFVDRDSAIDASVFDDFRDAEAGGGASDFVVMIIGQYLSDATSLMVELKAAVEERDAPALKRTAHSLRGASATVGAHRMAALCQELETLAGGTLAGTSTPDQAPSLDDSPALLPALDDEFVRVRAALAVEQGISGG
jgi:two-component system sensor histidine kinase/response regulator